MLNLQRIGHFLVVAEAGSLGKAARRVGLSQPALTKSIRKLEEELGFALVDRKGALELTALGRQVLVRARDLVGRADDLEHEANLLRGGQVGGLEVMCGPTVAETVMAPALARLVVQHPGLRINVSVGGFRNLAELLRARQIDLGVGEFTAVGSEPDLEVIPLPPQEIVFVCRAGHPLAKKRKEQRPVTMGEFFSFPLVGPELPDWAVRWLREHHPASEAAEGLAVTCNHYPLLKAVLLASDAVTGVPEGVVRRELECGDLIRIGLPTPAMVNRAGILHLRGRTLSPPARLLVEALCQEP